MTSPASMVLPRPTSSAISRFVRAPCRSRAHERVELVVPMLTPLRKGAWRYPRSALVAAPPAHGVEKCFELRRVVERRERGEAARSMTWAPGSSSPQDFDFLAERVLIDQRRASPVALPVLGETADASTSETIHWRRRTSTMSRPGAAEESTDAWVATATVMGGASSARRRSRMCAMRTAAIFGLLVPRRG